jgi:hypothetical protein
LHFALDVDEPFHADDTFCLINARQHSPLLLLSQLVIGEAEYFEGDLCSNLLVSPLASDVHDTFIDYTGHTKD